MRKAEPQSVGDILAKLAKKTELGKHLEHAQIWEQWPEIAGPSLCGRGRPRAVRDATLIIEVDSAVWMNKYAYFKWEILKRVNRLAKKELVSDVFFVLADEDELGK